MMVTVWKDLLDPIKSQSDIATIVTDDRWRHVVEKHVRNPHEPWNYWLTQELADDLRAWAEKAPGPCGGGVPECLNRASAVLEGDVRLCLGRPLMVLYRRKEPGLKPEWGVKTWQLVLPKGAVLIIRWRGQKGHFWTCFFDEKITSKIERPHTWWRELAKKLIRRYCRKDGGHLVAPPRSAGFDLVDKETRRTAQHTRVEFVTPTSWGFEGDQPGAPWSGLLLDWKAEPPMIKPGRNPRLASGVDLEVRHV
jgi:hypothetical protein